MQKQLQDIVEPLLQWYEENKRELPWRKDHDPYHVWISEIMLQQTRIEAVKSYYHRFMEELPTLEQLAGVQEEELLKLWEGLGYYSRARNLQKAAKLVMEHYDGKMPDTYSESRAFHQTHFLSYSVSFFPDSPISLFVAVHPCPQHILHIVNLLRDLLILLWQNALLFHG